MIAIIFGVLAWFWPAETLLVLVYLFAAYAIVDGVFALIGAFTNGGGRWVALVIEGILGIIAGIVAFVWPGLTAVALLYVIAAWAILTGIFEIIEAVRLRHEITNEFWLGLVGVLSIVFGVVIALFPGPGMLSLVWLLGVYAIVFGIVMIAVGIRLHGYHGVSGPPMTGQPAGA